MKYIKLFETYYYEINSTEFIHIIPIESRYANSRIGKVDMEKCVYFTTYEIETLCNLADSFKSSPFKVELSITDWYYEMFKTEDEWYYVHMSHYGPRVNKYYKCDQLEGLIKLLEG